MLPQACDIGILFHVDSELQRGRGRSCHHEEGQHDAAETHGMKMRGSLVGLLGRCTVGRGELAIASCSRRGRTSSQPQPEGLLH